LADNPWPFRKVRATRCPHCRREIRYQSYDPGSRRPYQRSVQDPYASAGFRVHVTIGVTTCGAVLTPHREWHWGPAGRWTAWAPLGGIGVISHHGPEAEARRQGQAQASREQPWLPEVIE
jgi:hypothetical protein